ncbi:MAG: hypothetical protein ABFD16_09965 [Thermoguttaceae bacterium]|jgi:hypothetical protein
MSSVEVLELQVKLRVPRDEMEDYVIRLRSGEPIIRIPEGLSCKDAFDSYETSDPDMVILRAGFAR